MEVQERSDVTSCPYMLAEHLLPNHLTEREIEKFIIRQPPIGEKDGYDSKNSWISDGLPSSSRRKKRGEGEGWREKGRAMEVKGQNC